MLEGDTDYIYHTSSFWSFEMASADVDNDDDGDDDGNRKPIFSAVLGNFHLFAFVCPGGCVLKKRSVISDLIFLSIIDQKEYHFLFTTLKKKRVLIIN